jgi:hypothetical protein
LFHGVFRRRDGMPNRSLVGKDLIVIASFESFVPEEVDLVKVFRFQEIQTVRFVPTRREAIIGDLSTNTVREVQIFEFRLHCLDHVFANVVLEVVLFIVVAFVAGTVSSNGRNVEHAAAEFEKCAALKGIASTHAHAC